MIEIADSTLKYDTASKAPLYSRLGVSEYWVINARTLVTRDFRQPRPSGQYGFETETLHDAVLEPCLVPSLAGFRLTDLGLEPM